MTNSNLVILALMIGVIIVIAGISDGDNLFTRRCREAGGYSLYNAGAKLCINPSAVIQLKD